MTRLGRRLAADEGERAGEQDQRHGHDDDPGAQSDATHGAASFAVVGRNSPVGMAARLDGVGVEPRTRADDVAEDRDVGTERGEGGLELLLLADQQVEQLVDLGQGRAELRLVVLGHPAQLLGEDARVDQQPVHGLLALGDLLEDQVAVVHQRHQVLAAVAEQLGDVLGVREQGLDLRVAGGDGLGEPGDAVEAGLDLRCRLVHRRRRPRRERRRAGRGRSPR